MGRTSDARERLLESAERLIHERGYTAVGVGEICADAGVNKGSFYYFFPSKQQLVLDVVDGMWQQTRSMIEQSLLREGPPLDRIHDYLDQLLDHHRCACSGHAQAGCPLGNLALEMSTQDSLLRERLSQVFDAQIDTFERVVDEARQEGSVASDLDPRATAEAIISLVQGKILFSKLRDDPEVLDRLSEQVDRLLGVS